MIGTVLRALGFFAISALLLGEGLLILWASLGSWAATMPGILAVLTGAGLWGLIAMRVFWASCGGGRVRRAQPPKRLAVAGRVGGAVRDGGPHYRHSPLTRAGLKLLAKFRFGSKADEMYVTASRPVHAAQRKKDALKVVHR